MPKRQVTEEQKAEAIELIRKGTSYKEISDRLGVSAQTISFWVIQDLGGRELELDYSHYKEPLTPVKDGFGFMGTVAHSKDGTAMQCHICGNLVPHVGSHIKTHKLNAKEYRTKFGLSSKTPLISKQMTKRYRQEATKRLLDPKVREKARLARRERKSGFGSKKGQKRYLEQDNINGTCPDQTITRIRALAKKLKETPDPQQYQAEYGGKGGVSTVIRHFGSWSNAMKEAGLVSKRDAEKKRLSNANLLELLQRFYNENGRTPQSSDFNRIDSYLPGRHMYTSRFGSLHEARMAAGIPILVQIGHGKVIESMDYSMANQKGTRRLGFTL